MVESIKHQKKSKLYHFLRCIICRFRGDVLHPWANPLLDVSDALEFSRRWRVPAKLSQASTRVHGRLGGWHGGGALKNSLESSRRVFKGVPCSYIFHFQDWLEKEEIKFSNSFFRWKTMENLYMYNVTLRYWNTKRWLEIHSMNVRIRFLLLDNLEFRLPSLMDNILHQLICKKTSTCLHYIIYCTFSIPAGSSDFLPSTICDEYPVKKKKSSSTPHLTKLS